MIEHEGAIRLGIFLAVLAGLAAWELSAPRRRQEVPRLLRWSNNLALVALDTALVRLAFPALATGFALIAEARGWGLLNALDLHPALEFVLALLALDLAIYLQHVLFHAVPVLWRLHRTHHSDPEFDVTTGLRFHPVEILLSMGLKLAVVAALGPPAAAVLAFEVILNATSMFTHANVRLPARAERLLRLVLVTPDMHRIHHSVRREETDSNFGFSLSLWDRLLGTYRAAPRDGQEGMTIGIGAFGGRRDLWLDRLLLQPLRAAPRQPEDRER